MEATKKQSREEKAENILINGRPIIKTSQGYLVPSESDSHCYLVSKSKVTGRIECNCPDFQINGNGDRNGNQNGNQNGNGNGHHYGSCKHIVAARLAYARGMIAIERSPEDSILQYRYQPEQIHSKQGRGYITGAAVIQRLLDSGIPWSFEIIEAKCIEDEVLVRGRLTMYVDGHEIVKEQYGGATFSRTKEGNEIISRSDTYKAACSSALKKAATLAGVGLHLYSPDDSYLSFQTA
jgi:hypothetical protein